MLGGAFFSIQQCNNDNDFEFSMSSAVLGDSPLLWMASAPNCEGKSGDNHLPAMSTDSALHGNTTNHHHQLPKNLCLL